MNIELLIEQILAIGLLVVGLSHWIRARMTADMMEEWRKSRFLPLYLGWVYLQIGSIIAFGHNVWAWDLVVIVTVLGWAWAIKGTLYLLWPNLLTRMMEKKMPAGQNHEGKFKLAGASMTVIGALLVWRVFLL